MITKISYVCDWCEREQSFLDEEDEELRGSEWLRVLSPGADEEWTFCSRECMRAYL